MAKDASGKETREHPRAPIELKVEYKKLNTFFSDYTKNISKGGTFIKTEKPLKVGTEFVFKLFVPAVSQTRSMTIVTTNTEAEAQRPEIPDRGMGIRFLYKDDDQKRRFEDFVEDMMKDALGDVVYRKLIDRSK